MRKNIEITEKTQSKIKRQTYKKSTNTQYTNRHTRTHRARLDIGGGAWCPKNKVYTDRSLLTFL